MLKRNITYEDFNGNTVTEEFYFNLTKAELITLDADHKGELIGFFKGLVEEGDPSKIVAEFTKLILMCYGEKSEDGKRFHKSAALREDFHASAAFDALFMDLVLNVKSAETFVRGVIPKDLAAQVASAQPQDKPIGPPRPPSIG